MAKIDRSIFRAYDIRGIYPAQVNEKTFFKIAQAFVYFLIQRKGSSNVDVVVGRDARASSPALARSFIEGVLASGGNVFDAGLSTTPLNYFGNGFLKADASAMITASHNPPEFNGLKLCLEGAVPFPAVEPIETLSRIIAERRFTPRKRGRLRKVSLKEDYLDFIARRGKKLDLSGLRIIVDTANGVVGPFFQALARKLKLSYKGLFLKPDGTFPNHEANPLKEETLRQIKKEIKTGNFDIGIAFDGDGDRMVALDEKAQVVRGDIALGIFVENLPFPEEHPAVVIDSRASRAVKEMIVSKGCRLVLSPVGYPWLRKRMKDNKGWIGGELSSHFYWRDFYNAESGLLAMVELLKILVKTGKSLSGPSANFTKYASSGEINFEVSDKEKKLREVEERFSKGRISHLDGLTVEYADWWFNLRPSNTENLLRLTVEAETPKLLEKKLRLLRKIVKK